MSVRSTFIGWSHGIRFYIAIGIVLFTVESWWWAEASYGGSALFATRLEELYAWTAVGLLSLAVSIGPICSVWPKIPGKHLLYSARRLLGIGAAWFSVLHVSIAYSSLFKFANPLSLPTRYEQAFALGAGASIVLLAMAFTSFDRAFTGMGKWWFRLHRFVYAVVVLVLLHAFLIGVHATQWAQLIILTVLVLFTLGLHVYLVLFGKKPATTARKILVAIMALLLLITLDFGYTQKFQATTTESTQQTPEHTNGSMPGMTDIQMKQMDGRR